MPKTTTPRKIVEPEAGFNLRSTDRITVCGLPGTGKTVLTRALAGMAMPKVLIYDPLDQYTSFPDENRYIPQSDSISEFEAICTRMCSLKNMIFVVEECERYLGQNKPLTPNAFNLVNRGRNWGVGIIAVTRRIQRMSKDYFDLCQHVFFFRCGLRSRAYVTEMIGKKEAQRVQELDPFHFLHYDLEREQTGEIATLDLGASPRLRKLQEGSEDRTRTSEEEEDE